MQANTALSTEIGYKLWTVDCGKRIDKHHLPRTEVRGKLSFPSVPIAYFLSVPIAYFLSVPIAYDLSVPVFSSGLKTQDSGLYSLLHQNDFLNLVRAVMANAQQVHSAG
ncbi:hypothetical protein BMS3Bbin04_01442 [bacterium BMS3Bbin04]|nr:hypothetical protein BMS3Bbin04_01442 [bacterium BMS3Bbin04]